MKLEDNDFFINAIYSQPNSSINISDRLLYDFGISKFDNEINYNDLVNNGSVNPLFVEGQVIISQTKQKRKRKKKRNITNKR